jgi:hypothetical protein
MQSGLGQDQGVKVDFSECSKLCSVQVLLRSIRQTLARSLGVRPCRFFVECHTVRLCAAAKARASDCVRCLLLLCVLWVIGGPQLCLLYGLCSADVLFTCVSAVCTTSLLAELKNVRSSAQQ